ncbi:hypothetical protein AC30_0351 [Escherichia coli 3-020-07_S3_C2]|nr:hypothetical protein ECDEC8C_0492 [Escherichia coli DEC8C]ENB51945.1 hypothetical protein ECP029894211_0298 [Escherichia coli P0298942.11]ENC49273.1 hypothetical protein ECP02999172_0307 [Escherichia coli P0299917.2]EYD91028.1 hypothetical protein AB11_0315 [Escherichia coli 1-176-05_S1_C1]KEJ71365.1 hypothetical protein AC30_0351 [Escherichia coli 3-020-07_S3_C2]
MFITPTLIFLGIYSSCSFEANCLTFLSEYSIILMLTC